MSAQKRAKVAELGWCNSRASELAWDIVRLCCNAYAGEKLASLRCTATADAPSLYQSALKPHYDVSLEGFAGFNTGLRKRFLQSLERNKLTIDDDLKPAISGRFSRCRQGVT